MDPKKPLSEARFTFLDTEGSGLSYVRGDDLIEIAIVRTEGMKVVNSWSSLIDAQRNGQRIRIKEDARLVHGIEEIDLAGKPKFEDLHPRIMEDLRASDLLIVHNAAFDCGFLVPKMRDLALPIPATPTLCSLKMARRLIDSEGGHGLDALRCRYGETPQAGGDHLNSHRALGDTLALYAVFFKMVLEHLGDKPTLGDLLRVHGTATPFINFKPR